MRFFLTFFAKNPYIPEFDFPLISTSQRFCENSWVVGPSKIYGVPRPGLRTGGLEFFLAVKKGGLKVFLAVTKRGAETFLDEKKWGLLLFFIERKRGPLFKGGSNFFYW